MDMTRTIEMKANWKMRITLPDNSVREYDRPVSLADVAADIGPGLAQAAIGGKINGSLADLCQTIKKDAAVEIITKPRTDKKGFSKGTPNPDAMYMLRHSCAHVMAEAILRLWPDAQLAYGPPVDNGFYYDLALDAPISSDDFPRIEAQMKKLVSENKPFTRYELSSDKGVEKLRKEKNKYKVDNAQRALEGGASSLSWYITGEKSDGNSPCFEDLCMGPHLPSTGGIGAFRVMSIATSHWHGDVNSDRFQRIYGTAFFTQGDLERHLEQLEEAKQRDHRILGNKLGLFAIDEQVGQGLILWKPRGAMVRTVLQEFLQDELLQRGYDVVYTPHIGKIDLYKTSGHYPFYADSQFPPIRFKDHSCGGSDDEYLLRPMNCPHHIKIYASDPHSYRELPIRLAEFGTVYRFEQSGELTGMTRVRGFTQDDAHIFCTPDQVKSEFRSTIELVQFVFKTFGFDDVHVRLSLGAAQDEPASDKYAGSRETWLRAEQELREVLEDLNVSYTEQSGEAAFYGPKVDFVVRDVIGRKWQLGTVQLDYNLPERFGLEYIAADNKAHRPVMIHRAPFGSIERFMAILIEHYAGAFPLWLAPEQVRVLPISEKFNHYAQKVLDALRAPSPHRSSGFRATCDISGGRVQAKIKVAQEFKIPYMAVVGGRDQEAGTVSVRDRTRGDLGAMPLDAFLQEIQNEVASRGAKMVKSQ